jgi:hypothetical protein
MRQLNVKKARQLQDYAHNRFFVDLDQGDEYRHLFMPSFWAMHGGKFQKNDWIRVRAHDGRFDVLLTVEEIVTGGLVMKRWPIEPSAEELAAAKEVGKATREVEFANDGKPTARVDHTAVTGWRVIGVEGSEISQGHKDEAAAKKALADYLKTIHYVMPSEADQAAELDRHAKLVAAREAAAQVRRETRRAVRG